MKPPRIILTKYAIPISGALIPHVTLRSEPNLSRTMKKFIGGAETVKMLVSFLNIRDRDGIICKPISFCHHHQATGSVIKTTNTSPDGRCQAGSRCKRTLKKGGDIVDSFEKQDGINLKHGCPIELRKWMQWVLVIILYL